MKMARIFFGLCLLMVSLLAIYQPMAVLAQEEPDEETIELVATYPTIEAVSGNEFEFEVTIKYTASESRVFGLVVTAPEGWSAYITPQFGDTRIGDIRIEPSLAGTKIKVKATTPVWHYQIDIKEAKE